MTASGDVLMPPRHDEEVFIADGEEKREMLCDAARIDEMGSSHLWWDVKKFFGCARTMERPFDAAASAHALQSVMCFLCAFERPRVIICKAESVQM
ncbi:unnamed protein product [Sphagnum balticum]